MLTSLDCLRNKRNNTYQSAVVIQLILRNLITILLSIFICFFCFVFLKLAINKTSIFTTSWQRILTDLYSVATFLLRWQMQNSSLIKLVLACCHLINSVLTDVTRRLYNKPLSCIATHRSRHSTLSSFIFPHLMPPKSWKIQIIFSCQKHQVLTVLSQLLPWLPRQPDKNVHFNILHYTPAA